MAVRRRSGRPRPSYRLYLYDRAFGEHASARWWHEQTELLQNTRSTDLPHTRGEEPDTETDDVPSAVTTALHEVSTTDAGLLPTALRILGALRTGPAPFPPVSGPSSTMPRPPSATSTTSTSP
ncbi:hypothetical protein ACIPQH_16850 [Streptomyces rubiginosohelvolus]|uniref:hypothetical protein n=1 Tax=Streptomyces TaxID=1883 RepID=UPI001CD6E756|nr:hypothetical protein [Streptomyces sp. 7G]MCA1272393.1 hypothetical protein [Streptomyces sp. 7G]